MDQSTLCNEIYPTIVGVLAIAIILAVFVMSRYRRNALKAAILEKEILEIRLRNAELEHQIAEERRNLNQG